MNIILFSITLDCSVVLACDLFVLQLTASIDLESIVAFIDVANTVLITFSYFYLSEWITNDLLEIGDHFYAAPWYRLAAKQQRLVMLPILRAEREFRLKGLGFFDSSLAVFSTVLLICAYAKGPCFQTIWPLSVDVFFWTDNPNSRLLLHYDPEIHIKTTDLLPIQNRINCAFSDGRGKKIPYALHLL